MDTRKELNYHKDGISMQNRKDAYLINGAGISRAKLGHYLFATYKHNSKGIKGSGLNS